VIHEIHCARLTVIRATLVYIPFHIFE
jgi:hypothetical protein